MARTKQPARLSTGGAAPRKGLVNGTTGGCPRSPPKQRGKYSQLSTNCNQCRSRYKLGTLPSNLGSIVPSNTFHQFSLLPLEIQTEIWKLAASSAANESRVIPVLVHWTPGGSDDEYNCFNGRAPIILTPASVVPPLLHACSFSRSLVLPHYELVSLHNGQHQCNSNESSCSDNEHSNQGDEGKSFYINAKRDMIYFTGHDVFDKTGTQHFPNSETHAYDNHYIIRGTRRQFCQPCFDLTFRVGDALRQVIGDPNIRKQMRNIGFGFEVPGLKRASFEREGLYEDFPELRKIVFGSEARIERKLLRSGRAHGNMHYSASSYSLNSNSPIPVLKTPSASVHNMLFEIYKERFHAGGGHDQTGAQYRMSNYLRGTLDDGMINIHEKYFLPLIYASSQHYTYPENKRSWLQWRKEGLVPVGWKGTSDREEWEDDGGVEWNSEYVGPRVEFLVAGDVK